MVKHNLLDLHLLLVGELKALRAEDFDTVKLVWIVGGGKHDGGIRVGVGHQVSDRRGRHGTQRHHIRSHRAKSRRDGAFQHVVRDAGVVSDQKHRFSFMMIPRDHHRCGAADVHRQSTADFGVGNAARAVGSKDSSHEIHLPVFS